MAQDETNGEVVAAGGVAQAKAEKLGFFARIALFFRQVIAELRKVVTPTRKELIRYTAVVLAFVVIVMAIVYGLDVFFSFLATIVFGIPA